MLKQLLFPQANLIQKVTMFVTEQGGFRLILVLIPVAFKARILELL
jgi:hypothetical protein